MVGDLKARKLQAAHPRAIPRTGEDLARVARTAIAASVPALTRPLEVAAPPKRVGVYVGHVGQPDTTDPTEDTIRELMRRPGVTVIHLGFKT